MNRRRSSYNGILFLSLSVLFSMLAGCSDDDNNTPPPPANTESLRIYEMTATQGSFTAVADDPTATVFHLNLTGLTDMLYFTNRGAQEAGYDTVENVMTNIWPRVYGTDAPNAIMKATTADQETIGLFCMLDDPVYEKATGMLDFTITYLDGQRPLDNLALTDVKMIIVNNAAQVQPQVWSTLMGGDAATLEPTGTAGVYTLYMQGLIGDLYDFTCAPHRYSRIITMNDYIDSWETRFAADPPNATISYNIPDNADGGAQVVVLTDPIYDEDTDTISFTAKRLFGTESIKTGGMTVNNASLFIDGGGSGFPTYVGNVFSIQYRNSTQKAIIVWLDGSQPPCSEAQAENCNGGMDPAKYSATWKGMSQAFKASGTHFYIHKPDNTTKEIDVSNHIELQKGETLRMAPPIVNGKPQWYYYGPADKKVMTAGVASWVTQAGINMPAIMPVTKIEYNLSVPKDGLVWFDVSAVDGLNAQVTMSLEGAGCGKDAHCYCDKTLPKVLKTSIDPYAVSGNKANDGCPYMMTFGGAKSCPNPKFYPGTIDATVAKPGWVVGSSSFSTADVPKTCPDVYKTAGSPKGKDMCDAASGDSKVKPAYHLWWSTNPVGQGWLNYLQNNAKGKCDAYGWAYDEKRWVKGKNNCTSFDSAGNPPDNKAIGALVKCTWKKDTYINIDILNMME